MPPDPLLARHLVRMRLVGAVFLLTLPAAAAAAFFLPRLRIARPSPSTVTLLMLLVAGWFAFTANRDASRRLARLREAFGEHGDRVLLLRGHLRTYLTVLLRLEVITACGLITASAGTGPRTTPWFLAVAAVLMLLAWPTERKARLLLRRVEAE